jgi:hypothetical protein
MFRTQVYLTHSEHNELSKVAKATGKKQSELVREAIDAYLEKKNDDYRLSALKQLAGMWKNRKDLPDFEEIRRSADREFCR